MATVTSGGFKRFNTSRQQMDVVVAYLDVNSANVTAGGSLAIQHPQTAKFDVQASILAAVYLSNYSVTPLGLSQSTQDTIGNNIGMRFSGPYSFRSELYYNNNRQYALAGSSSQVLYTFHVMIIYITTDDVYIPTLMTFSTGDTVDPVTYTLPTSSTYGFLTKSNYWVNGAFSIMIPSEYRNMSATLHGAEVEIENDPYANAGETGQGGGSGNFDYTGDTISEPSLPTVGAAATGFVSLFNPNTTQLQSLMDYLWSSLFDLDTIKRLYADPMQQFIGLSLVPVPVPSAGSKIIQVGGVSTGVSLTAASAQFVRVDCGSITFSSSSLTASYLDFLPYTKTQLYLPYIGCVDISTDDIMDKTVQVTYHVDILTGGCIAYIIIGSSVMYQYSGQCAINIPLTSIDWSNTISSALNLVSSAVGGLVAGAAVPISGGLSALSAVGSVATMGASAVNGASSMKPTINKSGAIGGSSGIMSVQKPFLIVTCPNLARAKKQDYFTGYPSFITKYVSDCSGFCSFEEIYLSGLGLTDSEMDELNAIMKEGVYL